MTTHRIPLLLRHQIHFVNETEDFGIFGILHDRFKDRLVIMEILIDFTGFDVKDVNQHLNVLEDRFSLCTNEALQKCFLSENMIVG